MSFFNSMSVTVFLVVIGVIICAIIFSRYATGEKISSNLGKLDTMMAAATSSQVQSPMRSQEQPQQSQLYLTPSPPIHSHIQQITDSNDFKGDLFNYPYNRFDGRLGSIGSVRLDDYPIGEWRKVGILTSMDNDRVGGGGHGGGGHTGGHDGDHGSGWGSGGGSGGRDTIILNLYQRTISNYREIFEYSIQDKNGFVIPLTTRHNMMNYTRLEDGDVVDHIVGYENRGPFKVNIFNNSKFFFSRFI